MDDIVRIGRVSSVDESGMIAVTYQDRGPGATMPLPVLANGWYRAPAIGDLVAVAHLSNGPAEGVVLGVLQNEAQRIAGGSAAQAVLDFARGTVLLRDAGGQTTVSDIVQKFADLERRVAALEAQI